MDLSIIIPTRTRPARLAACIGCLSRQDLPFERFEVLVGIDGEEDGESRAVAEASFGRLRAVVYEFPRRGYTAVRNGLIPHARGRILLSLNDDVLPEPALCRVHVEAHAQRRRDGLGPATIVGDAPWVIPPDDSLFDRLVRETSMIFFYDRMHGPGAPSAPDHDWGFRHAFGLNVSYPTDLVREVGGYAEFPVTYGYEDTEIAFRLAARFGCPVLFRPAARAHHDHRYDPAAYLQRERTLGRAAWGFARTSPACARALFGRDITDPGEVAYSREYVRREAAGADRQRESLHAMAGIPSGAIGGAHAPALIRALYEQHLLLKRWEWRTGLLESAEAAGQP